MTAKLMSIASKVMLSLLLAVIVGALVVLTVVPRAVGGAALTVLTGSMTPEIPVGSVVVVEPVDPGTLRAGDVITYQKSPGKDDYVTHRIVEVHEDTEPVTLTTKGDANRGEDLDPVPVTSVRGKVLFHVPYLGTIRNTISVGGSGLMLLVLGLLGYALTQVISALRDRKRAAAQTSAAPPVDAPPVDAPLAPVAAVLPTAIGGPPLPGPRLELQLLVVTLKAGEFEGLPPEQVAQLLRMDLVDIGVDTFTVALTREPDHLDTLVALLAPFDPVQLVRSEVLVVQSCPQETQASAAVLPFDAEVGHVAA